MKVHPSLFAATCLAIVMVVLMPAPAWAEEPGTVPERFVERDEMIPMRDGVRLHTKIFVPVEADGSLPFLMTRTPYGIGGAAGQIESRLGSLGADGYIFVFQDIRGKFGSEGAFVMQRPARSPGDTESLDEGTDTYDTIDWLLENVPGNNGRAGLIGVSYSGWTAIMGALEPHPALAAISPQASPADMWLFDRHDTFDWYLSLGSLANVNARLFGGKIPTWNDFVAHPDYDEFWQRQTLIPHIIDVNVPTLNVAGWWDPEDFYGPQKIYQALERHDTRGINHFVAGPWNHGGWFGGPADRLGSIPFDSSTGKFFRDEILAPFFAHYLKGEGELDLPEALTFEVGTNSWRRWDAWPPTSRTEARPLYFGAGETLSFTAPDETGIDLADSYVSDPAHPVPYRHRPIQATYFPGGSKWSTWLVEDQRFVDDRLDVLSMESAPLEEDLTIAGEVVAHLFASTTGSDADWVVKLIDVYPERYPEDWDLAGYQLMVSNDVFRGRYRTSFETPEPITPGEVLEYAFSLHTQNYTFKKGHRVMVQVQSSWFPIIDRNPQTFVPNIFEAEESDFQAATHSIHRSAEHPSHVVLPVVVGE